MIYNFSPIVDYLYSRKNLGLNELSIIFRYCSNCGYFRSHINEFVELFAGDNVEVKAALRNAIHQLRDIEFCKNMMQISTDRVNSIIKEDKETYSQMPCLAQMSKQSELKSLAKSGSATKKQLVLYFFKEFKTMYFVSKEPHKKTSYVFPTKNKRGSVRNLYTSLANAPQPYLLSILTTPTPNFPVTEELLINSLRKSFK